MSVIQDCNRCGEHRPIKWVVYFDIFTHFVCESCGQAALEIKKLRSENGVDHPGRIYVVSYEGNHYLN